MLTCTTELSKAKIQQPQLVPSLVPIIAQHDVAACDICASSIVWRQRIVCVTHQQGFSEMQGLKKLKTAC